MDSRHARLLSWQSGMLSRAGADAKQIVHEYCRLLVDSGYPLRRMALALTTLHPQMQALRYIWFDDERDPGPFPSPALFRRNIHHIDGCTIDEAMMSHGARHTAVYQRSPFYALQQGMPRLNYRLAPGMEYEFPVLNELAADGATHYLAYSLPVHEGQISMVTWTDGGFDEAATAFIEASLACLSALLNAAIKDTILDVVLDCYVGSSPAREIKQGNIRPGTMLDLRGAIWFSDIRNYSVHAQRNEASVFIDKLNAYYEAVVGEIHAQHGEVLKFIGDAVLAIFVEQPDLPAACERALAAARAANGALVSKALEFDHGVGLHLGQFKFGNIGSLRRMDFTVIGSDVNLAARIEAQCSQRQARLLMSQQFADQCGQPVQLVTRTELKGFTGEQALYTTVD